MNEMKYFSKILIFCEGVNLRDRQCVSTNFFFLASSLLLAFLLVLEVDKGKKYIVKIDHGTGKMSCEMNIDSHVNFFSLSSFVIIFFYESKGIQ